MRTTVSLLVFLLISLPLSGCIEERAVCSSRHDRQFEELTNVSSGELNLTAIEESRRYFEMDVTGVLFAIALMWTTNSWSCSMVLNTTKMN